MKLHLRTGYAIGLESGCFESQVLVGRDPLAGLVYQQRLCRGTLRTEGLSFFTGWNRSSFSPGSQCTGQRLRLVKCRHIVKENGKAIGSREDAENCL